MLRALYLKNLRNSYVASLNSYVGDVTFRKLRMTQKSANTNKLIAGVMAAAQIFSARGKADDIEQRIPMARSRAKAYIKREILDQGEFPVFQTRPKRATSL
jgi:hypothetical protein